MYRVVIIEDSEWARRGLRSLIPWSEHGLELVGEAPDGAKGLELILRVKPDIALLDIKMPQMDGLTMMEKLRECHHEGTDFIIVSAYDDFTFARQAIILGARDYLLKPIDPALALVALVRITTSLGTRSGSDPLRDLLKSGNLSPEFSAFVSNLERIRGDRSSLAGYCAIRMLEKYQTNLGAYDLAVELGISESTLARQFKKSTGMTFGDFLTMIRIMKAMELLLHPGSRVKEIASMVGFSDSRYFATLFRKCAGCLPAELRRSTP